MTMNERAPRSWAASASAAAWLPEEWVATPRSSSAGESLETAFIAPRNLNAPARCRFSHLNQRLRAEEAVEARRGEHRRAVGPGRDALGGLAHVVER